MADPSLPSVAIIITVFNDGRFLDEAFGSAVDVQLASRDVAQVSILVADDGSTERRTVEVLDRFERRGVSLLRLAHRGLGASRNSALQSVDVDWYIPLDADNRLRPTMVRTLLPESEVASDAGLVYGDAMRFGDRHGRWTMGPTSIEYLWTMNHIDSCGLIRRRAWAEVGGYSNEFLGLEDWDLWLRFVEAGRELRYVNSIVFDYRVRADSLTDDRRRLFPGALNPVSDPNRRFRMVEGAGRGQMRKTLA